MKSWWGDAATADNNWGYDYLPKLDKPYDMLQVFELMNQGKMNGYICQGFNPLAAAPNKAKIEREPGEAEVPGRSWIRWPPRRREFWQQLRRAQRRRPGEDPDRGVPPADHLLRRGERLARPTPRAGCSGTGRARSRRARRAATWRSCRELFTAHARSCTEATAARFPIRSSTCPGRMPSRIARSPEELAMEYSTARRWPTSPTRRIRPR